MSRKQFLCLDCKVDTGKANEFYYIDTKLWLSVVDFIGSGMLCIGCLETRIGRKLVASDFTNVYINNPKFSPKSQRLMDRLNADS